MNEIQVIIIFKALVLAVLFFAMLFCVGIITVGVLKLIDKIKKRKKIAEL